MQFYKRSIRTLFCAALIAATLSPSMLVAAQTRRGTVAASQRTAAVPKCSGAWTGTITYTRTQANSHNKTVDRVSGRGQDTTNWEMKYDYNAQVSVIEAPEKNGSSAARASISHSFSSVETVKAVEKNSCDRGKTWQSMTGTSISETSTSGTATTEANVNIGVNADGTYTVSVALPQIQGQTTGAQSSTYSGQCTPKEGKNFSMPPTPTSIDGNSLTSDGTHRLNPSDPNRISGSFSKTWQNVTETITWNLQKCGAPLRLLDLKFEDMKFPEWNAWQEISEQKGTIDGNLVKIKAKILNASGETKYADLKFKETYKGDKWDGAKPDAPFADGDTSVRVEAGEEKEVEFVWDSSGYAWYDDGRPRLVQRIKAELAENGKKVDELTKNLKVAPKPVVLVHGLWSSWKAWESWQNILTTSHSYDWKAFPVGEKPEKGIMNTGGEFLSTSPTNSIFENSQQLGRYIRYAQEDRNAWHVDVVAHSMGGLITRHYIHQFMQPNSPDGRPQIAHLVMLGTPNMGSPCADVMNTAFETIGKNVEAVRQLRQDVAAEFNKVNVNRKGVKFSVLAGDPLPVMCKTLVANDGVVPVPSAVWTIKDNARSRNVHTDLTGTSDFSSFVKPRLAVGPKGNHGPEVPDAGQFTGGSAFSAHGQTNTRTYGASERPAAAALLALEPQHDGSYQVAAAQPFAKAVRVLPKQTIEIEIPVPNAGDLGITFMAGPDVSANLFDESGTLVGKNLSKSPESNGWFRSIFVNKEVRAGKWLLKLENISDREMEAIVTSWENISPRRW